MLKIYDYSSKKENEVLRKVSQNVSIDEINSIEFKNTIKEIFDFINSQSDGAGLSAPQIGINKRFFIVSPQVLKQLKKKDYEQDDLVFINPIIKNHSKEKEWGEEGCFSVRWYYGNVERFKKITIEAYNLKGEKKIWQASDFLARLFQHEIDHLDGILFIDKAKDVYKLSDEEIAKIQMKTEKIKKKNA